MYFRIVGSSGSIHFERSTQLLMSPEDVDPDGTVKHVVEGDLVMDFPHHTTCFCLEGDAGSRKHL